MSYAGVDYDDSYYRRRAETRAAENNQRAIRAEEVLKELVRLKDVEIAMLELSGPVNGIFTPEYRALAEDYRAHQPKVWADARAIVERLT